MANSAHKYRVVRYSPWDLTEREVEVLDAVCEHGSNKEVARKLGVEESTVQTHLRQIYPKFGKTHRIVIVVLWTKWRLQHPNIL